MGMPSSGLALPLARAASAARAASRRAAEIADANRIDLAVVPFNAVDRVLRQLDGGYFLCRKRR